jgi:ubiquinone/menaquinone biosynthesis C-methylase UbiE
MSHRRRFRGAFACVVAFAMTLSLTSRPQAQKKPLDAPYVPSLDEIAETMLKLANVTKGDVVYDLGCGDGRIVIMAAKKFGARGVGVDIDPERIKESNENARQAGVSHLVRFIEQNLFEAEIGDATVVTLYLREEVNLRLRPKLLRELRPGARVVSNSFDMGDWEADKKESVAGNSIYFWIIPAKAGQRKRLAH